MIRVNPLVEFLGYAILPVILILTLTTENEVIGWITLVMLIALLTVAVVLIGYIFLQRFIEQIAIISHWSYTEDKKYSGYSIQAHRRLFGCRWRTNEYISGSEEEAQRFINQKNHNIN